MWLSAAMRAIASTPPLGRPSAAATGRVAGRRLAGALRRAGGFAFGALVLRGGRAGAALPSGRDLSFPIGLGATVRLALLAGATGAAGLARRVGRGAGPFGGWRLSLSAAFACASCLSAFKRVKGRGCPGAPCKE